MCIHLNLMIFTKIIRGFISAVLRFLVWVKPNAYIELTYTDPEGRTAKRKVSVRNENDAEELALLLRELKTRNEASAGR
ncbi:hypothetical protein E2131_25000 [Escherichia coli]|nr:hypothetical protein E2135_25125 [Escherichia coli]TEV54932.1 hypothetical protein E2131_25000 [Escherichia coli]